MTKKRKPKRHGIHITKHKKWNTKTVYNKGHVMHVYRHQPKTVFFKSTLVNDFNQHLCGGWFMPEIPDVKEATIRQLEEGRKPFASITYFDQEEAKAAQRRLDAAGLVTSLRRREWKGYTTDHVWDVLVANDMLVGDIGNMDALIADYAPVLGPEVAGEITAFAEVPLEAFFDEWDTPPLPAWLTGLILGYPVENTISLYLE